MVLPGSNQHPNNLYIYIFRYFFVKYLPFFIFSGLGIVDLTDFDVEFFFVTFLFPFSSCFICHENLRCLCMCC